MLVMFIIHVQGVKWNSNEYSIFHKSTEKGQVDHANYTGNTHEWASYNSNTCIDRTVSQEIQHCTIGEPLEHTIEIIIAKKQRIMA